MGKVKGIVAIPSKKANSETLTKSTRSNETKLDELNA